MSVIGFDDISFAQYLVPPLTTMRQPREQIGRLSAQLLIDILEGRPPRGPLRVELRAELVVRASTAPPARR
jgi:DNA-binding LacI/PurR family transcriptional regulator